jgi:general secretion pathway protein M
MNPTAWLNRFAEFWGGRDARERAMLTAAAAAVILGLIYAVLIGPALTGRERLNRELPTLRQQLAQLQALAREAANLAGSNPAAAVPLSKESLEAALLRKGLKAETVALTGDIARIQLSSVSFAGLMAWLDEMQKTALLSAIDANIIALAQPDMVNATLTLRQQKSE